MENNNASDAALKFLLDPERLTAVIATTVDNKPHANTIYYAMKDDFTVYFLTATDTRKHDNLLKNPNIAFTTGFGPEHTTVQGVGKAEKLDMMSEEGRFAVALLKDRMSDGETTWPIFQMSDFDDESIAIFSIKFNELCLMNLETESGLMTTPVNVEKVI